MSGVGLTEPPGAEVPALPAPERGTAPQRTCVGCGRKAPQAEFVRFAAQDGALVPGRGVPGRGAYTCGRLACFERAVSRRAFNRVLRQSVTIDAALSEQFTHRVESSPDG
jgi:uncharacterized protein